MVGGGGVGGGGGGGGGAIKTVRKRKSYGRRGPQGGPPDQTDYGDGFQKNRNRNLMDRHICLQGPMMNPGGKTKQIT